MRRSRELTRGHRLPILLMTLVNIGLYMLLVMPFTMGLLNSEVVTPDVAQILISAVGIVPAAFYSTMSAVSYIRLRDNYEKRTPAEA